MNVRNLLTASAVIALAACSDYDPGLSQDAENLTDEELAVLSEYTQNFTTRYGAIDPDHDWGFGEIGTVSEAKTRASEPQGNMWESMGYTAPAAITDAERAAVIAAFSQKITATSQTVNYTTFWAQHVYKGVATYYDYDQYSKNSETGEYYTDDNGNKILISGAASFVGSDQMDYLACTTGEYEKDWEGNDLLNEDHMFDFNKGESTDFQGTMLMYNTTTTNFSYHESHGNTTQWDHYYIKTVYWTEDGVQKSGTYIGFDYEATGENSNQKVDRDYIFNDWIIKITGIDDVPTTSKYQKRVMCEDLGNTDDFDFNDLVFDVYYEEGASSGSYTAHVLIQAAGGTLPIYVGPYSQEAHELLGGTKDEETGLYAPLNVGLGSATPKEITFTTTSTNPDNIDIRVTVSANKATGDVTTLPKSVGSQHDGTSAAPQKICVPVSVAYPTEHQQIETKYPNFRTWVADKNVTNWYKDSEAEGF